MREKLFAIGEDFWIENEAGEKAVKVDGKALRMRDTLTYYMQTDVGFVGYRPAFAIQLGDQPIVVFTQIPGGWKVRAWHTAPAMRGACSELRAFDVVRRSHPDDELIRY
jgi:hypothetical protein